MFMPRCTEDGWFCLRKRIFSWSGYIGVRATCGNRDGSWWREMSIVSICRRNGCSSSCKSSLLSQFSNIVMMSFDMMILSCPFFIIIIAYPLAVDNDSMTELDEHASRRDDGNLARSIGERDDFLTD